MYLISVVLLLFVFPAGSVLVESFWLPGSADVMTLIGKWFVFWAVGARLFIAGVRQVAQPQFTVDIFEIKDRAAHAIVREVGFGNLAMGVLGLASLAKSGWILPAAVVGGLYYGLAGVGHLVRGRRNLNEQVALVSDLLIFVLFAAFVISRGF
jgi:hypothetical protein